MSAAGVGAGDEVILPGFGGIEAAEEVRRLGAEPVIVDIDRRTFCIDPGAVEVAVTGRTKAVVAVHLFGHPAPSSRLQALTAGQDITLVEVGSEPREFTDSASLDTAARRRNAAYLDARLRGVVVPAAACGARHRYTEYVVRVPGNGRPDRDAYLRALRSRGVRCRVPVKTPVHRAPGFRTGIRLPEAERAADECLALPVGADLTKRELQRTVSACNALGGLLLEPAC